MENCPRCGSEGFDGFCGVCGFPEYMKIPTRFKKRRWMKMFKTVLMVVCVIAICVAVKTNVYAETLFPCTQQEYDNAKVEIAKKSDELREAMRIREEKKAALDAAIATGDQLKIQQADFDYQQARNIVDGISDQYFNALAYWNNVERREKWEEHRAEYTTTVMACAEYRGASQEFTNAKNAYEGYQQRLIQVQKTLAAVQSQLQTNPSLQTTAQQLTEEIASLTTEVANRKLALDAAKNKLDQKKAEYDATDEIVWSCEYGELRVNYIEPFYPIERLW